MKVGYVAGVNKPTVKVRATSGRSISGIIVAVNLPGKRGSGAQAIHGAVINTNLQELDADIYLALQQFLVRLRAY
jgi:hypothetical protein